MSKAFIKKEGVARVSLARYLFGLKPGERLKTIDVLSSELALRLLLKPHQRVPSLQLKLPNWPNNWARFRPC